MQLAPANSDVSSLLTVWVPSLRLVVRLHVFHEAWIMHLGTVRLVTSSCQAGHVKMR